MQEILYQLSAPLLKEHGWAIEVFKTRVGVLSYYRDMGFGVWIKPSWEAVDAFRLWARFKNIVGLTTSFTTSMKRTLTLDNL